jgi:hypothetical protein
MKILGPAAVVVAAICCAPTATAITGEEMCQAMHWPMPLPPPVGYSLNHLSSDSILICFDNVVATAPDGHDAANDPENIAYTWKITSMSPPAGTMVQRNQKITLTVVHDPSAPE